MIKLVCQSVPLMIRLVFFYDVTKSDGYKAHKHAKFDGSTWNYSTLAEFKEYSSDKQTDGFYITSSEASKYDSNGNLHSIYNSLFKYIGIHSDQYRIFTICKKFEY